MNKANEHLDMELVRLESIKKDSQAITTNHHDQYHVSDMQKRTTLESELRVGIA